MENLDGRTDDMLKIRGVNVFPSQIEEVLLGIDEIGPHYEIIVTRKNHSDILEIRVELVRPVDVYKELEELEKKIKHNGLCMKIDARITENECRALLKGDRSHMMAHPSGLVRELYCKMNSQQLRPRVLVSYIREPYVYAAGNVRVTFDSHIRSTLFHRSFLEERVSDIEVIDNPGDMILEVKYDAFLPDVIRFLLQTETIRQQAYSKYGACRRFG